MKRLLLPVFFSAVFQLSIAQDVYIVPPQANIELPIEVDVFTPSILKRGDTYQKSFPIKADQPAWLKFQFRNKPSFMGLVKTSAPFIAATAYSLLKQQKLASRSDIPQSRPTTTPYLVGGVLASGVSFALTPKHDKVYVELTYRNQIGGMLRKEAHWVNTGKPIVFDVRSPIDGWIDVNVTATKIRG